MIEIRWATEQEVMAVSGEVPLNRPITDILDDWRPVAVVQAQDGNQQILLGLHLVGLRRSTGRTICASPVMLIDIGPGCARTASGSVYLLASEADGPMPERVALGLVRHLLFR